MSRRSPHSYRRSLAALACAAPLLAPLPAHANTCSGLQLNPLTTGAAGTNPIAVAVGDWNRDGRMDVATVNNGSNDVTVLLGNGSGGLSGGSTVSTGAGSNPVDIAAGDVDQDGILDLVVAFGTTPQARVLQGLPGGGFDNTSLPFIVNAVPTRVYLGDFTNDGKLDLVVLAEGSQTLGLYGGATGITFNTAPLTNQNLNQVPFDPGGESPSGAAPLDFNRDGRLDLAVVMRNRNRVWILLGNGFGVLNAMPGPTSVGTGPSDVVAGDVNRDGWPDLVTANTVPSTASVLLNSAGAGLTPQTALVVGGAPTRVALADLDHDGILDVAALDASGTPRLSAFEGLDTGPAWFSATAYAAALPGPGVMVRGLAVADLKADGRADLVTAIFDDRKAAVVENLSGTPCARSSFGAAPRSYKVGDRPVSSAAADFNSDGRKDLVVATGTDKFVRILNNFNGGFSIGTQIDLSASTAPRAVATADMDVDGDMDVVVAQGDGASGRVQVYIGTGTGGLVAGAVQVAGLNLSALAIGDLNGDGAPDVLAASEDTGQVFRFLNLANGTGGLGPGLAITVGAGPRALVAVDLNGDLKLDLAVANALGNSVSVLQGNGDGTFTGVVTLGVGLDPRGIAAADLNGDLRVDLVTADFGSGQASVILQNAGGGFLAAVPYAVGTNATAVALLDLQGGDGKPEIAVTTSGGMTGAQQSLIVLTNNGSGAFTTPGTDHTVRNAPQAITPIDADNDGLVDLAIPCSAADAVVILIQRPPGPPVFSTAPRTAVYDQPRGAAAADFDGDGDLDLAVANSGGNRVSLLRNTLGSLAEYDTKPAVGAEAVVAGDFNGDGKVDLAVSAPGETPPAVVILFGGTAGAFAPQPAIPVGSAPDNLPDDLVAGDFDKDGDLDLAVCIKGPTGGVTILRNGGAGTFTVVAGPPVGNKPTAIVAADFDRDGDLDLAVGNDESDDVMILRNAPPGTFSLAQTLFLAGGDASPVSLATGDFDANGMVDLAVASFDLRDRIHLYSNLGTSFNAAPSTLDAPALLQFVTSADVNLDGKPDLVSLGAGVSIFRGIGGMAFEAPETVVAGHTPFAAVVADFNRDGRPDVAAVNERSDDVTLLTSSACSSQRIEVLLQPTSCGIGAPPYLFDASVKALDDGGNAALCAAGVVSPSIVPPAGGANLGGPATAVFASGVASFSGLSVDLAGRYRLQFLTAGAPPVQTGSFTLTPGGTTQILGPNSVCPGSSGVYSTNRTFDTYTWTLVPAGPPAPVYTPTVTLTGPPLSGSYTLDLLGRDECVTSVGRSIFFGDLSTVTLQITGAPSVCVDCIGGSAKAVEQGGGATVSRRWGYRTVSGTGPITDIPGETGEVYVLKGANFPGPGTYFVVARSTPTCGLETTSTQWIVTVVASVPSGEVRHLAASSRGTATSGQNQLRWVNTTGSVEEIRVRWDEATPPGTNNCTSPASINAPFDGEGVILAPVPMMGGFLHSGPQVLLDTAYCYSVFVKVAGAYSPGRTVKARPFDSGAGPLKWSYATGGTAVAPPTLSIPAILAMSNDRTVHALTRGSLGGDWPAGWVPTELNGVAHSRSPVVPFPVPLFGADTVLFVDDDATPGFLHSIDVRTGNRPWAAQSQSLTLMGPPAGIFTQFGGIRDALFVGTRDGSVNNALRALDVASGTLLEAYGPGGAPGPIGPINGSAAVDYGTRRVYFASVKRLGGHTLFCLDILDDFPAVLPVFAFKWSRDLGSIIGSPVLRGGRVYVGTDAGVVYSLDAANGNDDHTFTTGDGPVKGFLFPDRRNDDLIFATDTQVHSISDDGVAMTLNWRFAPPGLNPSIALFRPGTSYVYVGSKNGEIYELDFTNATSTIPPDFKLRVLGGGQGQIGAPSLDIGVAPPLLLVGSEPGVVYALETPFPP